MTTTMETANHDSENDGDSDVAFATLDLTGVSFDVDEEDKDDKVEGTHRTLSLFALAAEEGVLFGDFDPLPIRNDEDDECGRIRELYQFLANGQYRKALGTSATAEKMLGADTKHSSNHSVAEQLRIAVLRYATNPILAVEAELVGVASLNLFLQLNYTGPSLDCNGHSSSSVCVNPHSCFAPTLRRACDNDSVAPLNQELIDEMKEKTRRQDTSSAYHNAVLAELAVEGEWPCQVCQGPYYLLLARSILSTLASPNRDDWTHAVDSSAPSNRVKLPLTPLFPTLRGVQLWSARALVAHERLLQSNGQSVTLWDEAKQLFQASLETFCLHVDTSVGHNDNMTERLRAASAVLEWGLAQHHFNRPGMGKLSFHKAMEYSGLQVEMTGAMGKRTKFQQDARAQMVVHATSCYRSGSDKCLNVTEGQEKQMSLRVEHADDGILLERIKFEDNKENEVTQLSTLDQAILLSLCLDVKNSNPADGLTAEQMTAYLARVLDHHNDWMVYSTALLERAWVECEQSHGRERAILQIQALADQHSDRLTLTQSTFSSVEDSAPPQERLRRLHTIVYPPRWLMIRDLAERYASIGVTTSAAELFEEIELWDEVVECYRHAGRTVKAEQVVRERLAESDTPRMWAALGDLTNDPSCFEKALLLSNGRFSSAFVALGKYHYEKGDLRQACTNYQKAVEMRPLMPHVWFRLGTIGMQLGDWELALSAFSEVVQQEPEEADAWANVAAVHMHNKQPAQAFPALLESLKFRRNNWRVWTSKLYTCIDLEKYDEAIQACHEIMNLKGTTNASEAVPEIEEKCVRAIVGGSIAAFQQTNGDTVALDSSRRTLSRVHDLLERLSCTAKTEPWIWDTLAFFNEQVGRDEQVLENLMKEYRSLQAIRGWEKDVWQIKKMVQVVSHISQFHKEDGSKESLAKCKFLLNGVIKKIRSAYVENSTLPDGVKRLDKVLTEVEEMIKKQGQ